MPQYPSVIAIDALNTPGGVRGTSLTGSTGIRSVSNAGDVNGDGVDDIVVGGGNGAYVVFGLEGGFGATVDLQTLDGSNGFVFRGERYGNIGRSVSSAGDVNGDGFDDVLIGADNIYESGADPTVYGDASAFVVFGRAGAYPAVSRLLPTTFDGGLGFRISSDGVFGTAVSDAGDVNGDGFDDVIVAGQSTSAPYGLNAYVVFGTGDGFDADIDVATLDGTNGFVLIGAGRAGPVGGAVSSAGDVNGDGFDDLLVGRSGSSAAYVVFGKSSGFTPTFDVTGVNGANGFVIDGGPDTNINSVSLSSAGDINGDGFDDVAVSFARFSYDGSSLPPGVTAAVVFGSGGGFPAEVDVATLNGANGFRIVAPSGDRTDYASISTAGDVNGDGFDDLIVGLSGQRFPYPEPYSIGAAYVVFGSAAGFAPAIDLTSLDGSNGFRITGPSTGRQFGVSVSAAGDVDGDGFDDLIVASGDRGIATSIIYGFGPGEAVTRTGTARDEAIRGGAFDDTLQGAAGDDLLFGGGGADTLDGGAGVDVMTGGTGDDLYLVNHRLDRIVERPGEGRDTVRASIDYTLGANVEDLILLGALARDGTGNELANFIRGNSAANLLDGGGGVDTLSGGAGNDIYVVDAAGDIVVEAAGGGDDLVRARTSYTLGANVERLTLLNGAAINGTGNGLNNVIVGNDAANILNGAGGADTMAGGLGDDTYIVDSLGDLVTEAAGGGLDTVITAIGGVVLAASVENLVLTGAAAIDGAGNAIANTLTGNAAANLLDGRGGDDRMVGGLGDDTYVVNAPGDVIVEGANAGLDTVRSSITYTLGADLERLTLTGGGFINGYGNAGANLIIGNAGQNVLDGRGGADVLMGGDGSDTYIVGNAGVVVTEAAGPSSGLDVVQASISYALTSNVERLTLTGAAAINGTGNGLDNVIVGNDAANVLNGAGGADLLSGRGGADIYVIDNAGDVVIELANGGIDTVQSSITHTLAANVERLTLTGAAATNGTGNELNNLVVGNVANNIVNGGLGADTLTGGAGLDSFAFNTELGFANVDTITDFNVRDDTFRLDDSVFIGLPVGWLAAAAFTTGTAATDAADRIIYNQASGAVLYDRDGSGTSFSAQVFAFATPGLAMTAADFLVV